MPQWEYCVVTEGFDRGHYDTSVRLMGSDNRMDIDLDEADDALAHLGREGWELVSVTETELRDLPRASAREEQTEVLYYRRTYYLKRPIA